MAERKDVDPQETREWLDSLHSVLEADGVERAHELVEKLIDELRRSGAHLPYKATTAYLNTIRKSDEERCPGDRGLEHRIRSLVRWNALAMVMKANAESKELGGQRPPGSTAATSSTSRATRRRGSTRARSWRVASASSSCCASDARWTAAASRRIRIPG
jgi:pyruvate dehydrogenase E1 component